MQWQWRRMLFRYHLVYCSTTLMLITTKSWLRSHTLEGTFPNSTALTYFRCQLCSGCPQTTGISVQLATNSGFPMTPSGLTIQWNDRKVREALYFPSRFHYRGYWSWGLGGIQTQCSVPSLWSRVHHTPGTAMCLPTSKLRWASVSQVFIGLHSIGVIDFITCHKIELSLQSLPYLWSHGWLKAPVTWLICPVTSPHSESSHLLT